MGDVTEREGKTRVTSLMRECLPGVSPDTPVSRVLELFGKGGNHPVLVLDPNGTLNGIITPSDILGAVSQEYSIHRRAGIGSLDHVMKGAAQTARDLVGEGTQTILNTEGVAEALRLMDRSRSQTLVVVNDRNIPLGCIDLADIIAVIADRKHL